MKRKESTPKTLICALPDGHGVEMLVYSSFVRHDHRWCLHRVVPSPLNAAWVVSHYRCGKRVAWGWSQKAAIRKAIKHIDASHRRGKLDEKLAKEPVING